MTNAPPVIAIDGPTASGKGTIAQRVAEQLGFHYLDSGALYRLVAWRALRGGHALANAATLAALAQSMTPRFAAGRIELDGVDVTDAIRSEEALLRMDIHRNCTAIVLHGDGLVSVDGVDDVGAMTGERFVNRVVEDLEDHVVQARPVIGIADVHSRALADRIEAF